MDRTSQVVSQVLIRNGRFAAVGNNVVRRGGGLTGRRPQREDRHSRHHRRPQPHRPRRQPARMAHAARARLHDSRCDRGTEDAGGRAFRAGEFITTVGPISAMQFDERRLPNLTELDAVDRPVYIQAAQGGTRTNSQGKAWLEAQRRDGCGRRRDRRPGAGARAADAAQGAADARDAGSGARSMRCSTTRSSASPRIATAGAFHAEEPAPGVASENTYTMHNPFLALAPRGTNAGPAADRLSAPGLPQPPIRRCRRCRSGCGTRSRSSATTG